LNIESRIEIVDRLYKPDAANLENVVVYAFLVDIALNHRQNQAHICVNKLIAGGRIAVPNLCKGNQLLGVSDFRQFAGIHARDFNS
jgi:hypothetical protein